MLDPLTAVELLPSKSKLFALRHSLALLPSAAITALGISRIRILAVNVSEHPLLSLIRSVISRLPATVNSIFLGADEVESETFAKEPNFHK